MEPSLRSSTQKGNECNIRRTDPAVHETTKRFVESLCNDIRISQYADLAYAAKLLSQNKWYWLEPVSGGRVGYLVFLPNQPVVWIDDQLKQSFKIQMRISHSVYDKQSVMIASLNKSDGLMRLEDVWHMEGKSLLDTPFTQRWEIVLDFFKEKYIVDYKLQQGLRFETAVFQSLHSVANWQEIPAMMIAQGEHAPRRLRVQFSTPEVIVPQNRTAGTNQNLRIVEKPKIMRPKHISKPLFIDDSVSNESVAKAVPHEEFPDTYNIWMNGVKKGYAAVQDLELSRQLRNAFSKSETKELMVKTEWNTEFNMYQILSLQ